MRLLLSALTVMSVLFFQAPDLTAQTSPQAPVDTVATNDSCGKVITGTEIDNVSTKLHQLHKSTVGIWIRFYLILADKDQPEDRVRVTYTPGFNGWGQVVQSEGQKYILTLNHLIELSFKPDSVYISQIKEMEDNKLYKRLGENAKVYDKGFDILVSASPNLFDSKYSTEILEFGSKFKIAYNNQQDSDGFALLQLPTQLTHLEPAEVGQSQCLGLGAQVWEVGSERPEGFIKGIDVHSHPVSNIGNDHAFQLSNPTLQGSSGSGIFAFYNGSFKLVGLTMASEEMPVRSGSSTSVPTRGIIMRIEDAGQLLKTLTTK